MSTARKLMIDLAAVLLTMSFAVPSFSAERGAVDELSPDVPINFCITVGSREYCIVLF
jgi:hypothetical protein